MDGAPAERFHCSVRFLRQYRTQNAQLSISVDDPQRASGRDDGCMTQFMQPAKAWYRTVHLQHRSIRSALGSPHNDDELTPIQSMTSSARGKTQSLGGTPPSALLESTSGAARWRGAHHQVLIAAQKSGFAA